MTTNTIMVPQVARRHDGLTDSDNNTLLWKQSHLEIPVLDRRYTFNGRRYKRT
jgi:hypothetical protein